MIIVDDRVMLSIEQDTPIPFGGALRIQIYFDGKHSSAMKPEATDCGDSSGRGNA